MGRVLYIVLHGSPEVFSSFPQAVDMVQEFFLLPRQAHVLKAVEAACEQPQIGMHHRQVVGVGIKIEKVFEEPTRPVVLEKSLQAMSAAAANGQKRTISGRKPLLSLF